MVKLKQVIRKFPPIGTRLPAAIVTYKKVNKLAGGIKRHYRYRPGTRALQEIKYFQKTTKLLIQRISFQKLVKEIFQDFNLDLRIQSAAIEALREATESWITELFEDAYLCTLHSKRVTLKPKDLHLSRRLRILKDK